MPLSSSSGAVCSAARSQDIVAFHELPVEVLASVLGIFCDGKAISTFLVVTKSNRTLRTAALRLCRAALVQRYTKLREKLKEYEEIRDALDVIRHDIRREDDLDGMAVSKFSELCAVLDYFETQLSVTSAAHRNYRRPQWIVWSGRLCIPYGDMESFLVTPDWSVGAVQYWRQRELATWSMTHPRRQNFVLSPDQQIPYGSLFGMNGIDRRRMTIQSNHLEVSVMRDTIDPRRHALVSLDEVFDYDGAATIVFVDHSFISRAYETVPVGPVLIAPGRHSLCCCWDKENGEEDWEDALANLGKHVIRIMNSFRVEDETFHSALIRLYAQVTEFTNFGQA
jgi:hypothetical protein